MILEIRLLQYAREINRQKSFTKAALQLCVAQPSLSQQIAKLEHELGVRLFYRSHSSVVPTQEGIRFLEKAEQILQLHDDLITEMLETSEGIGTELTIGVPAITGEHVLPPLIEAYQTKHPQVSVRLVEDSPKTLESLTTKGETDLSILPLPVEDTRLVAEAMLTEPIVLATPPQYKEWMSQWGIELFSNDLSEKRIALSKVADAPFILLKQGYGFRQTVLELCAECGFQPKVAYETSSIEMAQSLVAHGLGVSLVPSMVRREYLPKRPTYLELIEQPTRTIALVYRKDRYMRRTARVFLEMCREPTDSLAMQ